MYMYTAFCKRLTTKWQTFYCKQTIFMTKFFHDLNFKYCVQDDTATILLGLKIEVKGTINQMQWNLCYGPWYIARKLWSIQVTVFIFGYTLLFLGWSTFRYYQPYDLELWPRVRVMVFHKNIMLVFKQVREKKVLFGLCVCSIYK